MGWDADAIYDNEPFGYVRTDRDLEAKVAFERAVQRAMNPLGVDCRLRSGGLDLSGSVAWLARATNEVDRFAVWSAAEVREKCVTAMWPELDELSELERCCVLSAKAFLETCAERGYGIQFDP